jgi:histidinol-phosphate aminotransferase
MSIKIADYVVNLMPYKSGNQSANTDRESFKKLINLASNENQLGPSPKAVEAMKNAIHELAIYPDVRSEELQIALAKKLNKHPDQLVFGHGSDALIQYVILTFSQEGEEILTAEGTFIGIYVNANKLGRIVKTVPLKDYTYDLDAIAENITSTTKIIYLANANNPTGTMFTREDFVNFMKQIPSNILVVLDEAYHVYSYDIPGYTDGLTLDYPNMIVLQTFSKSHGLAGLRIGYACGPVELMQYLVKVKLPFDPNILAQAAALAAIDDIEFLELTRDTNKKSLKMLTDLFDEYEVEYAKPAANFVMILLQDEETAKDFAAKALEQKIVTRNLKGFKIPNAIRISTGTIEQTEYAVKVFREILKK